MKLLIVSWAIPPMSGGSSVIIDNLARNFKPEELIVLGSATILQSLTKKTGKSITKYKYFRSELYLFGRGYRYFIWFRRLRFRPLLREIKRIIKTEQVTDVIGVYPNPFYCLAACRAAKQMDVSFSSYFHNTYVENTAITDPHAPKLQAEIFANSAQIFVMSAGMKSFYDQKYGGNEFIPLVHTFAEWPNIDTTRQTNSEGEVCQLVAIGNFNESNLDATLRLIAAIVEDPKYRLHIYTHVPQLLLQRRGLDTSQVVYHTAVSPEQVHHELQKYDVCVLTHGFEGGYGPVEYQTIFPTRTIPFLLSGKPILAHAPSNSFLTKFLIAHDCAAVVVERNTKDIVTALERISTDSLYRENLISQAKIAAQQFYGPNVAANLRDQLVANRSDEART